MRSSSSDFINPTSEIGISGKFLEMARNGRLLTVSEAIQARTKIAQKLATVEGKLRSCNEGALLAELAIWCMTRRKDFSSTFLQFVAQLEDQKCKLLATLRKIDQQLAQEDSSIEWTTAPAPMTSLVPRLVRKSDPFVAERNEVIDGSPTLSTHEICKLLDRHFVRDGHEICEHLPRTWTKAFGVRTFSAAYRDPGCRNRVHKLISVRRGRHLRGYP